MEEDHWRPADRELILNRWNTEFKHRLTPDYYQSFGLGFYEYFLLCEDIGAEPMPIINCGMACQFNTGELVPMNNWPRTYGMPRPDRVCQWSGRQRVGPRINEMGHPEPFDLKLLGVGNEQWGPLYIERYKVFVKAVEDRSCPDVQTDRRDRVAIRARYFSQRPTRNRLSLSPPVPQAQGRRRRRALLSASLTGYLRQRRVYDDYPRATVVRRRVSRTKALASPGPEQKIQLAFSLLEAAFVTGLGTQRRPDVLYFEKKLCLATSMAGNGGPILISFDNLRVFGTPGLLHPQTLYSMNRNNSVPSEN